MIYRTLLNIRHCSSNTWYYDSGVLMNIHENRNVLRRLLFTINSPFLITLLFNFSPYFLNVDIYSKIFNIYINEYINIQLHLLFTSLRHTHTHTHTHTHIYIYIYIYIYTHALTKQVNVGIYKHLHTQTFTYYCPGYLSVNIYIYIYIHRERERVDCRCVCKYLYMPTCTCFCESRRI